MDQVKGYFNAIVEIFTTFFALLKAFLNTESKSGLDELFDAAHDAGLGEAAEELFMNAI